MLTAWSILAPLNYNTYLWMMWSGSKEEAETQKSLKVSCWWSQSHLWHSVILCCTAKTVPQREDAPSNQENLELVHFLCAHLHNQPVQWLEQSKKGEVWRGENPAERRLKPHLPRPLWYPSHQSSTKKQSPQFMGKEPQGHSGCHVSFPLRSSGTVTSGGFYLHLILRLHTYHRRRGMVG